MALEEDFLKPRPFSLFALPQAWGAQAVGWRSYLPLVGVFALLIFGGSVWAQGLFVLCVGVLLWQKPPRYALNRQVDLFSVLAVLIVLLTLLPRFLYGLLPLRWLRQGRWRGVVEQLDAGVGSLYTPQPWLSLEWLILLLAALAAVALIIHLPQNTAQRWRWALAIALGLGALGLLGALGGGNPQAIAQEPMVPALAWAHFPNFGTAMAIGSVLAFALLCSAIKERWAAGVPLLFAALAGNVLGLLSSGVGLWAWAALIALLWLAVMAVVAKKVNGILRTAAVVLVVAMAALIIFAQRQGAGWLLNEEGSATRSLRYYDAATVVLQQPAMGVGLGNFAYVFPFYQKRSLDQGEITQPGNDWLWIATEMGLFGLAMIALIGCALIMTQFGKGSRRSTPVRVAGLGALLLVTVGSWQEAPMHYLGTAMLALACLQIGRYRNDEKRKTLYPRWLWRVQGGILFVVGLLWLGASLLNRPWQSRLAASIGQTRIEQAIDQNAPEMIDAATRAQLHFTPMDWRPHQERGRAHILLNRDLNRGKADFDRALALVPQLALIPFQQGIIWLPHSTREAESAFGAAIERHSAEPEQLYADIVSAAVRYPYFQGALARLSEVNDRMRFAYLTGIQPQAFTSALAAELRKDASLRRFTNTERRQLLELWVRNGNARNAIRFLQSHPDIITDTWYLRALALARLGSYKEAVDLLQDSLPMAQIPAILPSAVASQLEMPIAGFTLPAPTLAAAADTGAEKTAPTDDAARDNTEDKAQTTPNLLELASQLQQQLDTANWEAAQQTALRLISAKNAPAYAYYWAAYLYHRAGDSEAAWPLWEKYARHYLQRSWQQQEARIKGVKQEDIPLSTRAFQRWGTIADSAEAESNDNSGANGTENTAAQE